MMELSQVITLITTGGFTVFLIFMGIRAYRERVNVKKPRKEQTFDVFVFNFFTMNKCALNPEDNSGSQVKYIEPYFSDDINSEFTNRKCGSDD